MHPVKRLNSEAFPLQTRSEKKACNEKEPSLAESIPQEIWKQLFSYHSLKQLSLDKLCCQNWNQITSKMINQIQIRAESTGCFGEIEWLKYFGDIGIAPPLPENIDCILDSPCPFFKGQKVRDTHDLILVPETLNGAPLSIGLLEAIIQKPKQGNSTTCQFFYTSHIYPPVVDSHWTLIPKSGVYTTWDECCENEFNQYLEAINSKSNFFYEIPSIRDIAICKFMNFVKQPDALKHRYSDYGQEDPYCVYTLEKGALCGVEMRNTSESAYDFFDGPYYFYAAQRLQ
jgi:hypothetical protein